MPIRSRLECIPLWTSFCSAWDGGSGICPRGLLWGLNELITVKHAGQALQPGKSHGHSYRRVGGGCCHRPCHLLSSLLCTFSQCMPFLLRCCQKVEAPGALALGNLLHSPTNGGRHPSRNNGFVLFCPQSDLCLIILWWSRHHGDTGVEAHGGELVQPPTCWGPRLALHFHPGGTRSSFLGSSMTCGFTAPHNETSASLVSMSLSATAAPS